MKSIHELWATSARSFSIQKYISVMSLCFLSCGAAYIDIDGLVCCQEPFFFFFFFFLCSHENFSFTFFFINISTSVFIFYFLFFVIGSFVEVSFAFNFVIQFQFTKYYIFQFGPYLFDFYFFFLIIL